MIDSITIRFFCFNSWEKHSRGPRLSKNHPEWGSCGVLEVEKHWFEQQCMIALRQDLFDLNAVSWSKSDGERTAPTVCREHVRRSFFSHPSARCAIFCFLIRFLAHFVSPPPLSHIATAIIITRKPTKYICFLLADEGLRGKPRRTHNVTVLYLLLSFWKLWNVRAYGQNDIWKKKSFFTNKLDVSTWNNVYLLTRCRKVI